MTEKVAYKISQRASHSISILGLALFFCCILLCSCSQPTGVATKTDLSYSVSDFRALSNMDASSSEKGYDTLFLNYTNAIDGFILPDSGQLKEGAFVYSFRIHNAGSSAAKFKYKVYYQNESYKFCEYEGRAGKRSANPLAVENFYGSWDNVEGFRETGSIAAGGEEEVRGTFRIMGNPRDEQRYFSEGKNDRWKRNPRAGKYSFLLVVYDANESAAIPAQMADLSKVEDGSCIHPYYYYLYDESQTKHDHLALASVDTLLVIGKPPLDAGVYIDPKDFPNDSLQKINTSKCGNNETLRKNAAIKQFIHYVDSSTHFDNIPLIADVTGDQYSLKDHNWNVAFTASDEMIRTIPSTVDCPCSEIEQDSLNKSIRIINRASTWGNWKKQNVGIITRHGMTYGTYTVKVKLTELLNRYGMWNGLTNAIWLITQASEDWNRRRSCDKEGYILDYFGDGKSQRDRYSPYSEIDFEILKTSAYCPSYIYPPAFPHPVADPYREANWNLPYPDESLQGKNEIMVCCTNWDMACPQPENYDVGCQELYFDGRSFAAHRWDYWYKAITGKTPAYDNELFGGPYYYFQIVWKPEEIIWKIGPAKDRLRTVGYMNSSMTSIPNNQMLLIISQEFHNTMWWPGSPFPQGYVPFPARDLSGEVFEITIE